MNNKHWFLVIFLLIAILLSTSCITINQSPTATPLQQTPKPSPISTPSLAPIEAFIADPSYNPGGNQLAGLGNAKITVDGLWQQRYGLTYYQTSSSLSDKYKPNDMTQLQKVLDELKITPWVSLYKASYFDCSDMSALLQRELSIRGFESWIVIGKDPTAPIGHAWLVVFLHSPTMQLIPVEATALELPKPGSTYRFSNGVVQTYQDYSRQGWVLQDIYQAIALWSTREFDYWNRADVLQKLRLPTIATISTTIPSKTLSPTLTRNEVVVPTNAPPVYYNLTLDVYPPGSGSISWSSGGSSFKPSTSQGAGFFSNRYPSGQQVRLTPNPVTGYIFQGWSCNFNWNGYQGSTLSEVTFNMNGDMTISACFSRIPVQTPSVMPHLLANKTSGPGPTLLTVTGTNFAANETGIVVTLDGFGRVGGITANSSGAWNASNFWVPTGITPGSHLISAYGDITPPYFVPTINFNVTPTP